MSNLQMKAKALAEGKALPPVDHLDNIGHSEADLLQPKRSRYKHFKRRHFKRNSVFEEECTCRDLDSSIENNNAIRHSVYRLVISY